MLFILSVGLVEAVTPSASKVDASPYRPVLSPGGLMEKSNASLQRGRQGLCKKADEPASPAEPGPDLGTTWHLRGHPLQMEEDLAVAGRCGAGIREGS